MQYKLFGKIIIGLIAIELISWIAFNIPSVNAIAFVIICVTLLGLSIYRLEYGIYAIIAELVLGSQGGALLTIPLGSFNVSLRLGLFIVVMLAWLIHVIRTKHIYFFQLIVWAWYVAVITFLGIGVMVGILSGNDLKNVFFDWNGYLFFGMILPFTQAIRTRRELEVLFTILFAAIAVLSIKTIFLLFMYSHLEVFQYYLPTIYRWVRDLRLAEITQHESGFYRVFFQSFIYIVFALFISLSLLLHKYRWQYLVVLGNCVLLIILSYSRSFWVAIIGSLAFFAVYLLWSKQHSWRAVGKLYGGLFIMGIAMYGLILGIINVPIPGSSGSGVGANFINERTQDPTQDTAGGSRMALLGPLFQKNLEHPFLGSGLGTTVSYATLDQRAQATSEDELYTTYAFEWGYLDLWLKLGIAGLFVYLILLGLLILKAHALVQKLPQYASSKFLIMGVMFGVISLMITHAITPYLNHPLGIAWIMVATVCIDIYYEKTHG